MVPAMEARAKATAAHDDMAGIDTIDCHMDDGAGIVLAGMPLGSHKVHHLGVAYSNESVAHTGTDAVTSRLLNVTDAAAVGSLVGESVAQGGTYGVGGEVLYMGGKVQQLELAERLGVDGYHGEAAVCQRAFLVEYHGADLRQDVQIVGSLHQNTLARRTANAAEERQWHTDDQGAGTTDH